MDKKDTYSIGAVGEEISAKYLERKGFHIMKMNYTKKWGEIDIIAQKKGKLYFFEVKSVSCENIDLISRENRPEENVHTRKLKRLGRAIRSYLMEKKVSPETNWQFDVLSVFIEFDTKRAKVRHLENIPLPEYPQYET